MTCRPFSCLSLASAIFACSLVSPAVAEDRIDFNQQIRPLLSDRCFACHGPDAEHREGGFRLDVQASAFGPGDSGDPIIVAGHPEQSAMIERITTDDTSLRMPPEDAPRPLTDDEIALLKKWVEQGAEWQDHWSYRPLQRPAVPQLSNSEQPSSPIDAFILRRLEQETMSPSGEAARETLIRRVTLDLTGLPPTLEEIDAFLADDKPDAYERLVDRLLASPRFGEHQAHYWLDAVRYGDTHGLHLDNYREMWPYREWVINAFNQNMPFDQFVREQLAGDLLENPTRDQLIASGYNRCHVTTSEGGSIAEEVYVRNVVERVNNFGTVFIGTTFDCTRCHDHKFDPITQHDYYSMFAYFNSLDGNPLDGNRKDHAPVITVPTPEQEDQLKELDQQLAGIRKELKDQEPKLAEAQLDWEQAAASSAEQQDDWMVLVPEEYISQGKADLQVLPDLSILASGTNPSREVYEVVATIANGPKKSVRLEGLIHESLTAGGAGRSQNSNVVLSEFELYVSEGTTPGEWRRVPIDAARADHEQSNGDFKIANAIDGEPGTGWAIEGFKLRENRTAEFVAAEPFGANEPFRVKIVLRHESPYAQHQFGRVRLSIADFDPIARNVPDGIRKILLTETDKRTPAQTAELQKHFRANVVDLPDYKQLQSQLTATEKQRSEFAETIPTTMVFKEMDKPKPSYLLNRGEYDQKGEEVERRTPEALPSMDPLWPNNRLGLAHWLVSEENPLTARVAVNRFWQQLFGIGLVKTSEDFGAQGERPSHPQLLDWLAVEFRESGWDMKHMVRQMVLSKTYRQRSHLRQGDFGRDPENRLLARGPRFRLDAEVLRDQALFVSGLLVEELGGPSVKPPQPDGLWYAVGYTRSNTARFVADTEPEKTHRRTLYTFIKRTSPPPQLATFDGPSRESGCVRRERTNTPLQVLMLFNDPQFLECARGLAERGMTEGGKTPQSVGTFLYRTCTGYEPTEKELAVLVSGYEQEVQHFLNNPEKARQLLQEIKVPVAKDLPAEELAAWTLTANILLSLDVVVTKN
ncbi:PSD1 and planctomycete cytochrome C domain-containing protein [Rubinisphaera margarita]|uniref:PSD1 and planctomycete cytochrome C domain-containing protein n=1 Tax=Rubinisphaera margarita TaxID=2909586 RepID=UPI001EE797E0|nr:PSD1 and planctomycete cytochrome C domain-containing protein [Rubinisphaera margarita]MCG6157351.1 PSD1 and planctomycete cytochrome C domain-containing protein [Rubinisphaera margarita]